MANELAISIKQMEDPVAYKTHAGKDISLTMNVVKEYLVQGKKEFVTRNELVFFMRECEARQLDPFLRECWLIKYSQKDNAQIVESIHHKRAKARRAIDCKGWTKGIIVQTKDGEIKDSYGLILEGEKLLGGFFEAKPAGWDGPWRLEVNLAGYIKKTYDGKITQFWKEDNQPTMIAKIAESQGLSALWGGTVGQGVIPGEVLPGEDPINLEMDEDGKYKGPEPGTGPGPDKAITFATLVERKHPPESTLRAHVEYKKLCVKKAGSVEAFEAVAAKQFDSYWAAFLNSSFMKPKKKLVTEWTETDWEAWVGTWKSLAATFVGKSKTTQFLDILNVAPESVKEAHREKWCRSVMEKHVKGERWPLDPPEERESLPEEVEREIVDEGFVDPGLQPPAHTPGPNASPEPKKKSVQDLMAERDNLAMEINNRFAVGVVRHVMGILNLEFSLQDNIMEDLKTRTLKEVKDIFAELEKVSDDIPF